MKAKTRKRLVCAVSAVMGLSLLSGAVASAEGRNLGINNWFQGVYALDTLDNNAIYVANIAGDDCTIYNDEGNVEKLTSNLENMISAGAEGILWMGMFENMFSVGPQMVDSAGVDFALYDKIPTDEATQEAIRNLEHFAGGAANDSYNAGIAMAEKVLADGNKTALIAGAEIGDPNTDARVNGFTETFEAGGGSVLSVTRVTSGEANGPQQACDNMLAAYPETDCFYCTGEDYTLAAINVVAKTSSDHEIKVYGIDLNPTLLENLKDGTLAACGGAHYVSALYAAIMLENALDGHKLVGEDGLPVIIDNVPILPVSAEFADLYQKFFIDENPYEEEEIANLLYVNNPDVTLDDLLNMINSYSLEERLIAKYNAGKVTAEELAAVGISVE